MWFDVKEGEHMSIALALRDMELAYPCPPECRDTYPLVFDPATPQAIPPAVSRAWLDHKLRALVVLVMDPSEAENRSWHSWRVTLACSLRAARDSKHPDGRSLELVKVFGRWRSDSAVQLYGRLDPDAYAGHVSASLAADAASINAAGTTAAMDNIDPPLFESFAAEGDDADDTDEGGATRPSEDRGLPAPAPAARRRPATAKPPPKKRAKKRAPPAPASPGPPRVPAGAMRVMVPVECFPDEACEENGGKGWAAHAVPKSRGTALVTFERARDATGLPFSPILLQRKALRAID